LARLWRCLPWWARRQETRGARGPQIAGLWKGVRSAPPDFLIERRAEQMRTLAGARTPGLIRSHDLGSRKAHAEKKRQHLLAG